MSAQPNPDAFLTWINRPLAPRASGDREPVYDRLFTRIVMRAPAPMGVA